MPIDPTRFAVASGLTRTAAATTGTTNVNGTTSLKKSSELTDAFGLSKDDFFKLFLVQLQNQDPTQPMDDKQMLTELSQFTMISTLEQVSKSLGGTQLAQASALIGDQVIGTDTKGLPANGIVDRIVQDASGVMLVLEGGAIVTTDKVTQVLSPSRSGSSSTSGA